MGKQRLVFNPLDPAYLANPYPTLAALREHDPVHRWVLGRWTNARYPRQSRLGDWFFTRHEHVEALLRDRRLGKWKPRLDAMEASIEPVARSQTLWMGLRDPPFHTPFKRLFAQHFSMARIRALAGQIEGLAERQLGRARAKGRFDLIADFADPLASTVLAHLLGIAADDWCPLVHLAERPMQLFDGHFVAGDERAAANADLLELNRRLRALRGQGAHDGLLQALGEVPSPDPEVGDDDVFEAQLMLMIYAGHGTMRDLIGNTVLCLFRDREVLEAVRADLSLLPRAVDETLRVESPACVDSRTVHQPLEVAGVTLEEGQTISLSITSANRDPRVFGATADRFALERPERTSSLAFGGGIHFCSGWALGKVQAEVAVRVLLEQLPGLHVDVRQPEWRPSIALRGLASLPAS